MVGVGVAVCADEKAVKRVASDASYIGLSHFITAVSQVCLQVYVVRATSPFAFGEYAAALAMATLVESIFLARSGEVALQYVGKYWIAGDYRAARASARRIRRLDWIVNWSLYGLVAIFAFALSRLFRVNWLYILGLGLMIPAQVGYGIYKSLFIASARLKEQGMFETVCALGQLVLGVVGVYFVGIPGLIAGMVAGALGKNLLAQEITGLWWPADEGPGGNNGREECGKEVEGWWRSGIHSISRNAFANGANQADIVILNVAQGAEWVAIYKVAKTLAGLPVRVVGPLWSALRPRMMKAWHAGDKRLLSRCVVTPSILLLVGFVLVMVPAGFFADDLIELLYGKVYVAATLPFLTLLVGTWFFSGMTAWFNFLVIIGEEKLSGTLTYGFLFVVTVLSGIFYGGGSAERMSIAVSASMIGTSILCWVVFGQKLRSLRPSDWSTNADYPNVAERGED